MTFEDYLQEYHPDFIRKRRNTEVVTTIAFFVIWAVHILTKWGGFLLGCTALAQFVIANIIVSDKEDLLVDEWREYMHEKRYK